MPRWFRVILAALVVTAFAYLAFALWVQWAERSIMG